MGINCASAASISYPYAASASPRRREILPIVTIAVVPFVARGAVVRAIVAVFPELVVQDAARAEGERRDGGKYDAFHGERFPILASGGGREIRIVTFAVFKTDVVEDAAGAQSDGGNAGEDRAFQCELPRSHP